MRIVEYHTRQLGRVGCLKSNVLQVEIARRSSHRECIGAMMWHRLAQDMICPDRNRVDLKTILDIIARPISPNPSGGTRLSQATGSSW